MGNEILVAVDTFQATVGGGEVRFTAGQTTVRAGHPILEALADKFAPLVPTYEFNAEPEPAADPAPPDPPPTPAAKKAAAKPGPR